MTGEASGNNQSPADKLMQLDQIGDSPAEPHVKEFARLLSDRVHDTLVPVGFITASELLIYDLERGVNGFTNETIESDLVKQSPDVYKSLQDRLPELAEAAFSTEFAEEVGQHLEKLFGKPANKVDAEILSNIVESSSKVEVAAVLDDGTNLYLDEGSIALEAEFDPSSYHSSLGSAYGDAMIEEIASPLVEICKQLGRYYGFDEKGLIDLIEKFSIFKMANVIERIPDLRKVEFEGKTIYFPTEKLLQSFGVVRKGIDAPEAGISGVLSYFMKNSPAMDETPAQEENLPEIDLPGLDPIEMVRTSGELPATGMLISARITRGGPAVFKIYNYDNIEEVKITETGEGDEYQYLHPTFRWSEDSNAKEVEFSYEPPNYFFQDTQPYNRTDEYSYMGSNFESLDIVELSNGGRLLITKEPYKIGNFGTRLDQIPWKSNLIKGQSRSITGWFSESDIEGVTQAAETIARDLIGLDEVSARQFGEGLQDNLTNKPTES